MFATLLLASAVVYGCSAVCTETDEKRTTECLKPMIKLWNKYVIEDPSLKTTAFPIFKFRQDHLLYFCQEYRQAQTDCFNNSIQKKCKRLPLVEFVDEMLSYVCGDESWLFFKHLQCIQKGLEKVNTCYDIIRLNKFHLGQKDRCKNVVGWYDCTHFSVEMTCGKEAREVFTKAVHSFGCETDKNICTTAMGESINVCLNELIVKWRVIRATKPAAEETIFPLYQYKPAEMRFLCDTYQEARETCYTDDLRVKCKAHSLIKFTEEHLGYACRDEQEAFFRNFKCLSNVTRSSDDCTSIIKGQSVPGDDGNKCDQMPNFHGCLKKTIADNCSEEALRVFEESVDQYGCDLDEEVPLLSQRVCRLKMDPGPCNKVFIRWFFNSTTNKCERFVYGGCNGNGNNFISFNDCDTNCKEELALELKNAAALIANDAPDTSFKVDEEVKKTTTETEMMVPKNNATLVDGLNCAPLGVCPAPECAILKLHDSMCETCFCTTEPWKKANDTTTTTWTATKGATTTTTTTNDDKLIVGTNCPPAVNCVKTGCSMVRLRGGCEACYCLPTPSKTELPKEEKLWTTVVPMKEEWKATEKPKTEEMKTTMKEWSTTDKLWTTEAPKKEEWKITEKPKTEAMKTTKKDDMTTMKPLAETMKTTAKPLKVTTIHPKPITHVPVKITTHLPKTTLKVLTTAKPISTGKPKDWETVNTADKTSTF